MESLLFLSPERVAITSFPGGRTSRIEAFSLSKKEAALLTARFGGSVRLVGNAPPAATGRTPIRIRGRLLVVDTPKARAAAHLGRRHAVIIPAGIAFGTGEHGTTASCLRLLCDVSEALGGRRWSALDLGTGSGILAIAASKLGAARVQAWDFDGDAIRTARENLRANAVANVALKKADVTRPFPPRKWEVVSANLYSEVLIRASAKIATALLPGGYLILSGILREQEDDCLKAFERRGLEFERRIRAGKWSALLMRKPPGKGSKTIPLESPEKLLTPGEHDSYV